MNYLKVIITLIETDAGLYKTYSALDRGLVPKLGGVGVRALAL